MSYVLYFVVEILLILIYDLGSADQKQDGVLDKNRMMDNVQKHNIFITVLSQTFRSYLQK
jgi:hypothetical protein